MIEVNPLLLTGAVIGTITALLIAAYVLVKDKKSQMGFERTMKDGEIMHRLVAYAKPYWKQFVLVLFLMMFSIAYDIISPLIIGNIDRNDNIYLVRTVCNSQCSLCHFYLDKSL